MSIVLRAIVLVTLTLLGNCQLSDPGKGPVGRALLCWSPVVQCRQRCDIFLPENFVGEVIDGYQAPVIYLTREAYLALRSVIVES